MQNKAVLFALFAIMLLQFPQYVEATSVIQANPDKVLAQINDGEIFQTAIKIKNMDNITHVLTINSTSQYTSYSEIYDIPVSEITLKPDEDKYVLLKIITNGTEIIAYNLVENGTVLGSFFVITSSKNGISEAFIDKLKYGLILSNSTNENYVISPDNVVVKSRISATIPYFGIVLFIIYAGITAFLLKRTFPRIYMSNAALFVILTLIISSTVFYVV